MSNSFKTGVLRLYDDSAAHRGIILHPTALHCAVSETYNPTGSSVLTAITFDQGVYINATLSVSKIATNRTDDTLIMQAQTYLFFCVFLSEIFGFDGTSKYINLHLHMQGKPISNATQLAPTTYVYTPTLRATHIEFSDVATSGATY